MASKKLTQQLTEDQQYDELCRKFETTWNTQRLSVEQFLLNLKPRGGVDNAAKARLIQSEIELLRKSGESPTSEDYNRRFPDLDSSLIEDLFTLPTPPPPMKSTVAKPLFPNPYRVGKKVGAGGIGEVWQVFDRRMERPLAGKVLLDQHRKNYSANVRLEREARLTGLLQHPGVPPVYDFGDLVPGSKYFVMKLVEGETLDEILGREGTLQATHELIAIFEQVVQTLAYAHSQHVIHRDLKPQNIMVGKFGEVQVMDWGMAKLLDHQEVSPIRSADDSIPANDVQVPSRTDTAMSSIDSSLADPMRVVSMEGDVFGTPAYMPPEQAQGNIESLGPSADVFALGAILFEILTGERLHSQTPTPKLLKKAASGDLTSCLDLLDANVEDPEIRRICKACLATDKAERPQDAAQVAAEISRYLANVQARRQQLEREQAKLEVVITEERKRKRLTMLLASLIVSAALLALGSSVWYQYDTSRRQDLADQERAKLLIEALQTAAPQAVPITIGDIKELSRHALPLLRVKFHDPSLNDHEKFRIGLALADQGLPDGCDFILNNISRWNDDESENLISAISNVPRAELEQLIAEKIAGNYTQLAESQPLLQSPFTTIEQRNCHKVVARLAILAFYLGDHSHADQLFRVTGSDPTLRSALIDSWADWTGPRRELEVAAMEFDSPSRSGLIQVIAEQVNREAYRLFWHPLEKAVDPALEAFVKTPAVDEDKLRQTISEDFAEFLSHQYLSAPLLSDRNSAELLLKRCMRPLPENQPEGNLVRNWNVNSVGMTMRLVEAGEFQWKLQQGIKFLPPEHTTRVTKSFFISDRPVTAGQYREFLESEDVKTDAQREEIIWVARMFQWRSDEYPAIGFGRYDMMPFCNWLSRKEGLTPCYERTGRQVESEGLKLDEWRSIEGANGYRLPYKCEFEMVCGAGTETFFSFGNDAQALHRFGWYLHNNDRQWRLTAGRLPNLWGIFDTNGFEYECLEDFCDEYPRQVKEATVYVDPRGDPPGPKTWAFLGKRGSRAIILTSFGEFDVGYRNMGFRVARFANSSEVKSNNSSE